ncbi:Rieske (2Fe-2S) protein, partial [Hydrogenophaga bisanensis]
MKEQAIQWRGPGFTRVPYEVYSDAPTAQQEQECIFRGATWNYLCLEAELPEAGSYRTTFVGETPVVVVKDADGE